MRGKQASVHLPLQACLRLRRCKRTVALTIPGRCWCPPPKLSAVSEAPSPRPTCCSSAHWRSLVAATLSLSQLRHTRQLPQLTILLPAAYTNIPAEEGTVQYVATRRVLVTGQQAHAGNTAAAQISHCGPAQPSAEAAAAAAAARSSAQHSAAPTRQTLRPKPAGGCTRLALSPDIPSCSPADSAGAMTGSQGSGASSPTCTLDKLDSAHEWAALEECLLRQAGSGRGTPEGKRRRATQYSQLPQRRQQSSGWRPTWGWGLLDALTSQD